MKKIFVILLIFPLLIISSCSFKQLFCKHNYVVKETVAATCDSFGKTIYECEKCGKDKEDIILKTEHQFGDYVVEKEATCVENGNQYHVCNHCGTKISENIPALGHDFSIDLGIMPATCTKGTRVSHKCSRCDEVYEEVTGEPLGHLYGEFVVKTEANEFNDGVLERTCSRCGDVEVIIIPKNDYIDFDILEYDYKGEEYNYTINSREEMSLLFNVAVLNLATKLKVTAKFDTNGILDYLGEHYRMGIGYQVRASVYLTQLSLEITYQAAEPTTMAAENDFYTQHGSFNLMNSIKEEDKRSNDYDNFSINSSTHSYDGVRTTDQLFYVVERFYKPNCVAGSNAERIYNKAKAVLRSIISDNMTDVEKVRAIYEYLIMNVCYDKVLYELNGRDSNIHKYKGFYLEGVFDDHRAVCEGISKAMALLCNMEGIRCVQVTGFQTTNPDGIGHAWNKVFVDGAWYVIDATSGGTIINNGDNPFEILTYKYFLIDNDTFKKMYTEENFEKIICYKNYNIYEQMEFKLGEEKYKFVANNFEDLKHIVKYFESNDLTKYTIEFQMNYKPLISISSEINRAYMELMISKSFSYIDNGDSVLIIK